MINASIDVENNTIIAKAYNSSAFTQMQITETKVEIPDDFFPLLNSAK